MTTAAAVQLVREAMTRFVEQCERATTAQWNVRVKPDLWSIGDVAEHVCIANQLMLIRLSKSLLVTPLAGRTADVIDVEIPYLFYRGDEPPNVATPTGTWTSWTDKQPLFEQSAAALLEWPAATTADLRGYGVTHPVFGMMDGIQWLLYAAAHTERHRAQLIGLMRAAEQV